MAAKKKAAKKKAAKKKTAKKKSAKKRVAKKNAYAKKKAAKKKSSKKKSSKKKAAKKKPARKAAKEKASQEESGEEKARDEGGGPDEADDGSRGHPSHHAADQADELTRACGLDSIGWTRIRGATRPVPRKRQATRPGSASQAGKSRSAPIGPSGARPRKSV